MTPPHPAADNDVSSPSALSTPRRDFWVLLGLIIGAYAVNLWIPRDLWVQDEARYGEVLREMLQSGSWEGWLVPHLNGFTYPDKPPVYFWVVAAVGAVVGQGEWAFRLVSFFATAFCVWGVYITARRLDGRDTAFWSSAFFSTIFLSLLVGQIARMDMLLCASAIFAWYYLLGFRQSGTSDKLAGLWAMIALGVAIKGPIALLFSLAPAAVWMYGSSRWQGLRSLKPLLGMAGLVAMVGIWISAAVMSGNDAYLQNIWNKQLVGRAVSSWSHAEPFYFYMMLAPLLFMPWTALVVKGGIWLNKARPDHWQSVLAFSLVPLLGISLVSGKLFIYMQPLIPAVCITAGLAVSRLPRDRLPIWVSLPPVVFLFMLGIVLLWGPGKYLPQTTAHHPVALPLTITGVLIITLAVTGMLLMWQQRDRWLNGWLGASVVLSWLLFGLATYHANPLFSARDFGAAIANQARDKPVGLVNTTRGILNFYAGRIMQELQKNEARQWWMKHPEALFIIKTGDLRKVFKTSQPADCRYHQTFTVELKQYHVYQHCRRQPK